MLTEVSTARIDTLLTAVGSRCRGHLPAPRRYFCPGNKCKHEFIFIEQNVRPLFCLLKSALLIFGQFLVNFI